jgi:hypothetical protein
MWRFLVIAVALVGCDEGTKSKVKETAGKVDKAVDKFEANDAKEHLDKAKVQLSGGADPVEDCSWVASQTDTDATKPALDELRKLCNVDAPLEKAKQAVVRAEKARAEAPDAPSLTECQSDDWANMKVKLASSGDGRWRDLEARWAKVCPDQK